jgi:hypothetical protein
LGRTPRKGVSPSLRSGVSLSRRSGVSISATLSLKSKTQNNNHGSIY